MNQVFNHNDLEHYNTSRIVPFIDGGPKKDGYGKIPAIIERHMDLLMKCGIK